jgi:hypothetical protein
MGGLARIKQTASFIQKLISCATFGKVNEIDQLDG